MATEAYCFKCREKREMKDEEEVELKTKGGNKRSAIKGVCPECGTKMFKFTKSKK